MELICWKISLCVALSVSILAVVTPTALGQTNAPTNAPEEEEEVIIGIGNTDVSCYTCDNVPDNDECNGADLGENGTLTKCPYERSNCFAKIKVNAAGDGYTMQKGCMDFDECYDKAYEQVSDPIVGGNCIRISLLGHDPIPANQECFYCCYAYEGQSLDRCNEPAGVNFLPLPTPNNWDPAVDKWEGHEPIESTEAPDVTDGGDLTARPLAVVIGINMLILSSFA